MKKIILVLLLNVSVVITSWGQLNPVRNLYWAIHWDTGQGAQALLSDTLLWNKPIPSLTDTLVGYNIYHDDSLFEFTTDTLNSCDFMNPVSPFCPFMNSTLGEWYTHVTAVYNQSHTESIYTDSIYWNWDMIPIGVKERTHEGLTISKIIQNNSSILVAWNQPVNNGVLIVSNHLGQEIKEIVLQKEQQDITVTGLSTGLYIILLKTDKGNCVRKVRMSEP